VLRSRVLPLVVALGAVAGMSAAPGTPASAPTADPSILVAAGAFGWPVPGLDAETAAGPPRRGVVTRRFLAPPTPYGRGHRGVDLAAAPGTPVLAAGAGTVVFAGPLAGRGVVSVLHADGLRTTYEPLTPTVLVGATLARGATLGVLAAGHRGCPSAACLHWGLRRAVSGAPAAGEQYLDPLLLVGLGRVRLLPWATDRATRR